MCVCIYNDIGIPILRSRGTSYTHQSFYMSVSQSLFLSLSLSLLLSETDIRERTYWPKFHYIKIIYLAIRTSCKIQQRRRLNVKVAAAAAIYIAP